MSVFNRKTYQQAFEWIKKEVVVKTLADLLKQALLVIISALLLYLLTKINLQVLTDSNILIATIIAISVLLIYYIIRYSKIKGKSFTDEFDAYPFLVKEIQKAEKDIKIIGHACTNIFYLRDAFDLALQSGVNISVLLFNPDETDNRPRYLKEEELDILIKHLIRTEKIPHELLYGLSEIPQKEYRTKIPIILSLLYGWYPFYAITKLGQDKYIGTLELNLYSKKDCPFKAIIIDDKTCVLGNFIFPFRTSLNDRQELIKNHEDTKEVVKIFGDIRSSKTTKQFNYQLRTGWRNKIYRITKYETDKVVDGPVARKNA
jgi:hypothetical protein